MFDSNVTVTVDTVTSMDVSVNNSAISGEDAGSLFETLEKIEHDVGGADSFVPDEDLSLADLMGLIEEGGEPSKIELDVAEVVVNTTEVAEDNLNVKCKSNEGASAENEVNNVVTEGDSPDVNDENDAAITINSSVETVNAADTSNTVGELEDSARDGAKIGPGVAPAGATFSPIQTIPKYCLREIFKHANGIIYLFVLCNI